jgi:Fe-S cluster biogenesis protein NfuA/nitrite reductase/ring-hydroxylating ferredoxin subunit
MADGPARQTAVAAIQALLALHGEGLAQTLRVLQEHGQDEVVRSLAADEVVGGLLLLHGLHPLSLEERVRQALDRVRPYLASHGGDVELIEVAEDSIRLRLEGSCDGCPSSAMTLKYAIEQSIAENAPDVAAIQVEGVAAPQPAAGFVPLSQIRPLPRESVGGQWQEVPGLGGLPEGALRVIAMEAGEVGLCRLADTWYAYRDACPACAASLRQARLQAVILTCGACGRRFDVRNAGRCLDDALLHLEPIPLLVDGGTVKVAIGAAATL